MNKIYFDHKTLLVLSELEILPAGCEDYVCVDIHFPVNLLEIIDSFYDETKNISGAFTIAKPEEIFEILRLKYKPIFAAGGIVIDNSSRFLMIYRNGKWDLPKGKIDNGEETEVAAIREVLEETGIQVSPDISEIAITFHTYKMKNKECLKRTDWFLMFAENDQKLIPQTDEGITEIQWVDLEEFEKLRPLSFPAICDVVDEYARFSSLQGPSREEEIA